MFLLAAMRLVMFALLQNGCDDAYITFRYARNLADGAGLVFNLGERVWGLSSVPWALLVSGGLMLHADPLAVTRVLSMAADLGTLWIMHRALSERSPGAAAGFGLVFAGLPFFGALAASGMESSAMIFLTVLAADGARRRAPWTWAALAGLGLIRPEGLLVAAVVALYGSRRQALLGLAAYACGYAATALWFGALLPQSMLAKASVYGAHGPWNGRGWWEWTLPTFVGRWWQFSDTRELMPMVAFYAPAAWYGAAVLWRERSALAAVAFGSLAILVAYSAVGAAFFFWYLALPVFGVATLAAVGAGGVFRGRWPAVALALFVVGQWTISVNLYRGRAYQETRFALIGQTMRQEIAPDQTLMLEPLGMIGWHCRARMVDEVGLVSPRVAARRGLRTNGWYHDAVLIENPDYLLLRRTMSENEVYAGAGLPFRTQAEVREILGGRYRKVIESNPQDGQGFALFRRR